MKAHREQKKNKERILIFTLQLEEGRDAERREKERAIEREREREFSRKGLSEEVR